MKKLDSVSCYDHPLLLRIFVGNIIHNSIRYSRKGAIINIYLAKDFLKIKDYDIGIQSDDIRKYLIGFIGLINQEVGVIWTRSFSCKVY